MWDAFQREVLGAMGHTLLVPVASPVSQAVVTAMPAPARAPAADVEARPALLHALARAAGIDGDIGQSVALPPLAELKTPHAKRRLWPSLRALRKTPPA